MADDTATGVATIPHKGIAQGFCGASQKKLPMPPLFNGEAPVLHELYRVLWRKGAQGRFMRSGEFAAKVPCRHVKIGEIGLAPASQTKLAAGLLPGFKDKYLQPLQRGFTGTKEACSSCSHDNDIMAGPTAEWLFLFHTSHGFMMAWLGY